MKKIVCVLLLIILALTGCGPIDGGYDAGCEDGYNGARKSGFSAEYNSGYEDGEMDAEMYDLGYYDARNDNRPRHLNDSDYMDGYRDGQ